MEYSGLVTDAARPVLDVAKVDILPRSSDESFVESNQVFHFDFRHVHTQCSYFIECIPSVQFEFF